MIIPYIPSGKQKFSFFFIFYFLRKGRKGQPRIKTHNFNIGFEYATQASKPRRKQPRKLKTTELCTNQSTLLIGQKSLPSHNCEHREQGCNLMCLGYFDGLKNWVEGFHIKILLKICLEGLYFHYSGTSSQVFLTSNFQICYHMYIHNIHQTPSPFSS